MADLGSFDECINIDTERIHSYSIYGKYCLGAITISLENLEIKDIKYKPTNMGTKGASPGGQMGVQLAACLPHTCSSTDMAQIYSHVGVQFDEKLCQTLSSAPKLDFGSKATLIFLSGIFFLMLVSTVYDTALHYFRAKPYYQIFIAFSVLSNGRKILATSGSPHQISCLHGIRVISTMWVILGHRYIIQNTFPYVNSFDVINWMNDPANMFIMEATVSVDTFFLIAGLVIAYTYMTTVTRGIQFNIIMYYVHRYLRLTPVLAVVMLIHITLLRHLGSGPFWPHIIERDLISTCKKYWWKTLLYIQNYGGQQTYCIPQSWYLSVDTQLFVLSPVLLIPLGRWPVYTLITTAFLTMCSITTCFLTGWFFELNHNLLGNMKSMEQIMDFTSYYYAATQTRAAPWFIGLIVGYLIFRFKQTQTELVINKAMVLFLWVSSLAVLGTCVFAGHGLIFGAYDQVANSFHLALVRPAWAVALSFVIFACVVGYGGPVNWFLSLPIFQVLSKLTYTMYLAHYIVIYLATAQMRETFRFSNTEMMHIFWGDFVFTLLAAITLTLAFESPIITIEKVIFGRTKRTVKNKPSI